MNIDLILLLVFWLILIIIIYTHKSKFQISSYIFAMYRSKLGLRAMDKFSFILPKFQKIFWYVGIVFGYLGVLVMPGVLVYGVVRFFLQPEATPLLYPVIPGIKIPGLPTLSFFHFLISIFVVATIHEFSHGLVARLHKIKVKSSGFAILGPILMAFVEPEEKQLMNSSRKASLSVFSAGPFSNLVLGGLIMLLTIFLINPLASSFLVSDGIQVGELLDDSSLVGVVESGDKIVTANGIPINSVSEFSENFRDSKPGDEVLFVTDKGHEFTLVATKHPQNPELGYFGEITASYELKKPKWQVSTYLWIQILFFWLWVITVGVGAFNLLPLGPLDGGRILYTTLLGFFNEKRAKKILMVVTYVGVGLILINLLPFFISIYEFFKNFIIALL